MQFRKQIPSPLGNITLASDGAAITGLWFEGQKYDRAGLSPEAPEQDLPVFRETEAWLEVYFSGKKPGPLPPLAPRGTPFQTAVWQDLKELPWGYVTHYSVLAEHVGRDSAVRAAAGAVGRNPISILIPCHRVVDVRGYLTGYAGGLWRKEKLLELEGWRVQRSRIDLRIFD